MKYIVKVFLSDCSNVVSFNFIKKQCKGISPLVQKMLRAKIQELEKQKS